MDACIGAEVFEDEFEELHFICRCCWLVGGRLAADFVADLTDGWLVGTADFVADFVADLADGWLVGAADFVADFVADLTDGWLVGGGG